ncbi:hypothetical protein [Nonomuraea sp. NPDC050643]|uniref:hypothetical protein n=1 Tax=Nonomuraea sp. NPDC050643 TaxID=3155660 RepID=UPI003410BEC2
MSDIAPYDIAHVIGVLLDRTQTNEGGVIGANVLDEVLHIDLTHRDGDKDHFRAVVVEGETDPIVLERPAEPGNDIGGRAEPGMVVIDDECPACDVELHWSWTPEEARSLAAHYAALADEADRLAAQAQTGGAQ